MEKATEAKKIWTLEMQDDGGSCESVDYDAVPTQEEIESAIEGWVSDGDWGDDGASVRISWTLTDPDGDEIDEGCHTVEIAPDTRALIRAAIPSSERSEACGMDDEDHEWTSDGEGGCSENPGVWSTGGTSLLFRSHCKNCGLKKFEKHTGSQRNPGEHDAVDYAWESEDADE